LERHKKSNNICEVMVGATGFEPATSWTPYRFKYTSFSLVCLYVLWFIKVYGQNG